MKKTCFSFYFLFLFQNSNRKSQDSGSSLSDKDLFGSWQSPFKLFGGKLCSRSMGRIAERRDALGIISGLRRRYSDQRGSEGKGRSAERFWRGVFARESRRDNFGGEFSRASLSGIVSAGRILAGISECGLRRERVSK